MKCPILLIAALLAGCANVPQATSSAERVIPAGPAPDMLQPGFDRAATAHDLLATARERFGEPSVRRALAAETYLFAKFYPGMLPPPPPDAAPGWKREFPMAMLVKENGRWLAAAGSGFRDAHPERALEIDALLASGQFWSGPEWGSPGCTDAGATILMLKVPGRPEIVRRGTCGDSQVNERLGLAAINA